MEYREIYEKWRTDPAISEEIRRELADLEGDEAEIQDRFYQHLTFGTGGLRGILGAGSTQSAGRHRVWQTIFYLQEGRNGGRLLPMTPGRCPRNSPWRRHCA